MLIQQNQDSRSDNIKIQDSPLTFKIFRKEIEKALFKAYFDVIEEVIDETGNDKNNFFFPGGCYHR